MYFPKRLSAKTLYNITHKRTVSWYLY